MGVTLGKQQAKPERRGGVPSTQGGVSAGPWRGALGSVLPARAVDASDLASVRSPRLELRALTEHDRAAYLDAVRVSRAALDRWAALHRPGESDDELFDRQLTLARDGAAHASAFRRVAWFEGRIAGGFNLTSIARGLQFEADINWWVRSDLTRMGLGREGLLAMLEAAFAALPEGLGLHRVMAAIRPDNLWSVRLAERAGFVRLAERRSIVVGGRWEGHDVYERVA